MKYYIQVLSKWYTFVRNFISCQIFFFVVDKKGFARSIFFIKLFRNVALICLIMLLWFDFDLFNLVSLTCYFLLWLLLVYLLFCLIDGKNNSYLEWKLITEQFVQKLFYMIVKIYDHATSISSDINTINLHMWVSYKST